MRTTDYVLGHSDSEVRRLELQAALLAPGTDRILRAAGLRSGQRVLDIGTGAGDVAMLAASIVGPSGSVLGIDLEEQVLIRARKRAKTAAIEQVRFEALTLESLPSADTFDVVLGRYVLHHQTDRVAFLRGAAARVRCGGTLIFMENDLPEPSSERWSHPTIAPYEEALNLFLQAYKLRNVHMRTGSELVRLFHEAGLPEPALLNDVPVTGPSGTAAEWLALTLRSVFPILEKHGVSSVAQFDLDALQSRIESAAASSRSTLRISNVLGGWVTIGRPDERQPAPV